MMNRDWTSEEEFYSGAVKGYVVDDSLVLKSNRYYGSLLLDEDDLDALSNEQILGLLQALCARKVRSDADWSLPTVKHVNDVVNAICPRKDK